MAPPPLPLVRLLRYLRDNRLVWDLCGFIYNRYIGDALTPLFVLLTDEIAPRRPSRILDVGSGPGYLTCLLARRCPRAEVVGVDFSPRQVSWARRRGNALGLSNMTFLRGDALHLTFPDESFDAVASVGSIKHWRDPQAGMSEIRRVLKPGGPAIVAETDRGASPGEIRSFMARFKTPLLRNDLLLWGMKRIVFAESFTSDDLSLMARKAGFEETRPLGVGGIPYACVRAA